MLFAQKALGVMSPGGAIVMMSSMASQRANGRNPAYESSKAAQIALGRAIARAGEENGVRCNVIAPGFIESPDNEPVQTLRALQARPDHLAEPPGDGAADAQPRGAARHGAEPARDRVLR